MSLRRFGVWTNLLVSSVLMLAVWTLLVWVSSRPALRGLIDLTPQRANSVSQTTVELLRELRGAEAEVEFHLFLSELGGQARDERHAQEIAIRSRLAELTTMLLRRYAAPGGERVNVIQHDPYQDPAGYRTAAQAFAYTAADTDALVVALRQKDKERRFRKLSLVSDLAVIDLGGSKAPMPGQSQANALPVLKDFQGEKGITSALKSLMVQGIPVVYLLEGYSVTVDIARRDHQYNHFLEAMTQTGLEVQPLNLRDAGGVPDDAAMVICLEPSREFLPRDADYLYAYVRRGGRLLLNYAWSAIPDMNPTGGRLGELLGFELSTQPVFHRIPDPGRGGGSMDGTDGVMRLTLQMNPVHPTTRRMKESGRVMELFMGREVRQRRDRPKNVRIEELLATGGEGWLAAPGNGQLDFRSPSVGLRPYVVAMSCEVDPAGATATEPNANEPSATEPKASSNADTTVGRAVVVAGLFANDKLFPYFGDFALNICNWMTERRVLLDIETARFRMNSLDVQLPQRDRIWWLLVLYVPGAFLCCGMLMWWRRRH